MNTQPVSDILAKLQHNTINFFRCYQIGGTGNAMPDRLYGANIVIGHNTRGVRTVGVVPKLQAVDSKHIPESVWTGVCQVSYSTDTILGKLGICGSAYVEQFRSIQWPDPFFEVMFSDLSDRIGLLHVRAQFGKDLVERYADTDCESKLILCCLADILGYLHTRAIDTATGHVEPALVHAEGFHEVGIALVDVMGKFRVFQVLIVLGRYDNQSWAKSPSLPIYHASFHSSLFRQIRLGQHNTVPFFGRPTHRDWLSLQCRVEHHFNGCVKGIHIAVQYSSCFCHRAHLLAVLVL